jgi:hypothetical protein
MITRTWIGHAVAAVAWLEIGAATLYAAEKVAEVDPNIRKELDAAEKRFGEAIQKRDDAALTEILAEYYADSIGDAETAIPKARTIARLKLGALAFYRMERDQRLRVSGDYYDLEGEAKDPPRRVADVPAKEKWVHVRRVWVKKDGRWLLILQNVRELEGEKSEAKEK